MINNRELLAALRDLFEADEPPADYLVAAMHEVFGDDNALTDALVNGLTEAEVEAIRTAATQMRGTR